MLEEQANQRINPFMKGLSMLTGGIAGEFTGTNEDIRNRNYAKRALMEQNISDLQEKRSIDRQLMVNALQQGIAAPEGATLEEKMADFRNKSLRRQIAAGEGMGYGLGQTMGPSQYEAEPAFKIAATQAQNQMAQRRAELLQAKDLAMETDIPELVAGLSAYGPCLFPSLFSRR
jgi:hypothetical protein